MTNRELAARLVREFDKTMTTTVERALTCILRAEGIGRYQSEEVAFEIADKVLLQLEKYPQQELPFLIKPGGRLVGKSRVGHFDTLETIAARRAHAVYEDLLAALLAVTTRDFEIVCAAALVLAGACEMHALCTGDEGGIDFYGRLEIRQPSSSSLAEIAYTSILPKKLLVLGQSKRYDRDARIGRESVQTFKAQLYDCINKYEGNSKPPSHRVPDDYYYRNEPYIGVFATTASFSENATKSTEASGIVLIDGVKLAQFLGFHGVAVPTEKTGFRFDPNCFEAWLKDRREKLARRPA